MDQDQIQCPDCSANLERAVIHEGLIFRCNSCGGTLFGSDTLIHLSSKDLVETVWKGIGIASNSSRSKCPICKAQGC